jgi:hypothetical protein
MMKEGIQGRKEDQGRQEYKEGRKGRRGNGW